MYKTNPALHIERLHHSCEQWQWQCVTLCDHRNRWPVSIRSDAAAVAVAILHSVLDNCSRSCLDRMALVVVVVMPVPMVVAAD